MGLQARSRRDDVRRCTRPWSTAATADSSHDERRCLSNGHGPVRFIPNGVCLLCDEAANALPNLCDPCIRELPIPLGPCLTCGAGAVPHSTLCGACAHRPPPVDRTICALAYASPVDYLVGRLKFEGDLRVVPALAGVLDRAVGKGTPVDWLAPVPISPARLRERGFNQALEMARILARRRGVRLSRAIRRRRGADTPQASLPDTAARRANVTDVFEALASIDGHVAIVDDVVTTGATAHAMARCLKRAGARTVDVWAVARTP